MSYKVSTSEVATFLTCKQRWMYAHHPSYNLEPRTLGIALTRGVVGHKALETYYKAIYEGLSNEEAINKANDFLVKESLDSMMAGDIEKSRMISDLGLVLKNYFSEQLWILDSYEIVGVESLVNAPLPHTDNIDFVGRVDLLLKIVKGLNKGEIVPWDHKFCYNFWSESSIKMTPQIPNYIWAVREMGMHSRSGIISMIRYRSNAQESFKQESIETKSSLRDVHIVNHTVAAKQIVDLKQKSKVSTSDGITRSASKFNCEYCPFINLCYTEAQGLESETMIKASYRPNSYGYDNVLDVE
ncbi:PD-(D/E)XK nuclease family protein [Streptomyces hebeiensis]